jgi:hypothetical protein
MILNPDERFSAFFQRLSPLIHGRRSRDGHDLWKLCQRFCALVSATTPGA